MRAVVGGNARLTADESAAVDPHHHGERVTRGFRGRPHVEIETVFADLGWRVEHSRHGRVLHARGTELRSIFHAGPRLHRLRRFPAELADRWRREWNAFERDDAVCGDTGHLSAGNVGF